MMSILEKMVDIGFAFGSPVWLSSKVAVTKTWCWYRLTIDGEGKGAVSATARIQDGRCFFAPW